MAARWMHRRTSAHNRFARPGSARQFQQLRAHLRDDHRLRVGRPRPWRSLADAMDLTDRHDYAHEKDTG
jgi:hypothetical protein